MATALVGYVARARGNGNFLIQARLGAGATGIGLGKLAIAPGTFHLAVSAQDLGGEASPCVLLKAGTFRFPIAMGSLSYKPHRVSKPAKAFCLAKCRAPGLGCPTAWCMNSLFLGRMPIFRITSPLLGCTMGVWVPTRLFLFPSYMFGVEFISFVFTVVQNLFYFSSQRKLFHM